MNDKVITLTIPGAPDQSLLPGGGALVGVDGNAYAVMAAVSRILKRAGATREYVDAYMAEAMSGDYDHLLATSLAFITPEGEAEEEEDDDFWNDSEDDEDEEDEEFTFGDAMSLRFG